MAKRQGDQVIDGRIEIEKASSVAIEEPKRKRDRGIQVLEEKRSTAEKASNTNVSFEEPSKASYKRNCKSGKMNHRRLLNEILKSKDTAIQWCMEKKVLRSEMRCDTCNVPMKLVKDKGM